jgi:hypothetical protein
LLPRTNVAIVDLVAKRNYQMLCLLHEMEQLNERKKQTTMISSKWHRDTYDRRVFARSK